MTNDRLRGEGEFTEGTLFSSVRFQSYTYISLDQPYNANKSEARADRSSLRHLGPPSSPFINSIRTTPLEQGSEAQQQGQGQMAETPAENGTETRTEAQSSTSKAGKRRLSLAPLSMDFAYPGGPLSRPQSPTITEPTSPQSRPRSLKSS